MFGPFIKQTYASMGCYSLYITYGYIMGLQSIIIPELRSSTSGIQLTLNQESWIMSISFVSMLPTQMLTGFLSYKFGRRLIMILFTTPMIATLILLRFFCTYQSLLVGSLLCGIGGSGLFTGPMYIAEIASPKYRKVLLNTKLVSILLGMLMAHFFGGLFHWKDLIPYGFISIVIGMVTSATSPESPTWLAAQGRIEECRKSFKWFRGDDENEELEKLIKFKKAVQIKVTGLLSQLKQTIKNVTDKSFIKAMALSVACILFVDMNGKHLFSFYFLDTFGTMFADKNSAYYLVAGMDLLDLVTTLVSFFTARKYNIRTILFKAGFSSVITILVFCITSYLLMNNTIPSHFRWISLLLIVIYSVLLNVGVIPTLYCLLNEVVPLSHRELGLSISGLMYIAVLFFSLKFAPYAIKFFDLHGTFLIIAIILSISLLFLYFYLPETHNKTLQDIDTELVGNTRCEDDTVSIEKKTEEALIKPNFVDAV